MSKIKTARIFIKGLIFTLPILLTIAFIIWVIRSAESVLATPLKALMPAQFHFPGMGILLALIFIYLIGMAIHGRILRFVFKWMNDIMAKLPVISAIYNNIKEMVDFLSGEKDEDLERVVLVSMGNDARLLGFVTQQDSNISSQNSDALCSVYLPMSYQMGGYLVYLPESRLETVDISKQEAMQRILTADIGASNPVL